MDLPRKTRISLDGLLKKINGYRTETCGFLAKPDGFGRFAQEILLPRPPNSTPEEIQKLRNTLRLSRPLSKQRFFTLSEQSGLS